jgi:hypothetical protein
VVFVDIFLKVLRNTPGVKEHNILQHKGKKKDFGGKICHKSSSLDWILVDGGTRSEPCIQRTFSCTEALSRGAQRAHNGGDKRALFDECTDSTKPHQSRNGDLKGTFREHSDNNNIQGMLREHSGNIEGTFRENSRNAQGHSANIQSKSR